MGGLFAGTPLERPVTCEACERPVDQCACPRDGAGGVLMPKDQPARVSRERRAGNKTVTIITGLDPDASDLPGMLKKFKATCAAGGAVTGGRVELQGDHRDRIVGLLRELGYPAKASGG